MRVCRRSWYPRPKLSSDELLAVPPDAVGGTGKAADVDPKSVGSLIGEVAGLLLSPVHGGKGQDLGAIDALSDDPVDLREERHHET
jgi:hypothetical protein